MTHRRALGRPGHAALKPAYTSPHSKMCGSPPLPIALVVNRARTHHRILCNPGRFGLPTALRVLAQISPFRVYAFSRNRLCQKSLEYDERNKKDGESNVRRKSLSRTEVHVCICRDLFLHFINFQLFAFDSLSAPCFYRCVGSSQLFPREECASIPFPVIWQFESACEYINIEIEGNVSFSLFEAPL